MSWGWDWRPYVSVAERRANSRRHVDKLRKKGLRVEPVQLEGRKIARTFWGLSWCNHLESFSDYENRLPRGRTYVRNGSVCHLEVNRGEIKAIVSGSSVYEVDIKIDKLAAEKWNTIKKRCAGQVGSLIELLQGKLSGGVMSVVTDQKQGLFPLPGEIHLKCSCPDWATMCKHVAAVLYGVGARLDQKPELLFLLRGVDHLELIATDTEAAASLTGGSKAGKRRIASSDLGDVFGIEMFGDKKDLDHGLELGRGQGRQPTRNVAASRVKAPKAAAPTQVKAPAAATAARIKAPAQDVGRTNSPARKKTLTGKFVRDLRGKLEMSVDEFSVLVGASTSSVRKWEQESGELNCRETTRIALLEAGRLSKKEAWRRL
jgi:uncharacterized Zn finger protein/DNA-binding transcriptional regulator YiaG